MPYLPFLRKANIPLVRTSKRRISLLHPFHHLISHHCLTTVWDCKAGVPYRLSLRLLLNILQVWKPFRKSPHHQAMPRLSRRLCNCNLRCSIHQIIDMLYRASRFRTSTVTAAHLILHRRLQTLLCLHIPNPPSPPSQPRQMITIGGTGAVGEITVRLLDRHLLDDLVLLGPILQSQ
ncbi:hypothetical protein CPB84DRAFT_1789578 [Gymnopilus junonius]|uniref:Uncharacterized protein n=1 Tax=Gymnopilus junonius TaxID=109634 RepID=A0A9P5NHP8_GYMJU|nr:hypothetical protein CPB84DRAFT_1789578 [Gymnopilus junonius]